MFSTSGPLSCCSLLLRPLLLYHGRWVFLYYNHEEANLDVVVLENDDTPAMNPNTTPVLLLDLWEHAFYLDVSTAGRHTNENIRSIMPFEAAKGCTVYLS